MPFTSAGSSINIGPTITGITSPPITMMPISIEFNTGTPDSGNLISTTDSTPQSIPLSSATAQSTEVRCCLSCYLVHCFDIFLLHSIV